MCSRRQEVGKLVFLVTGFDCLSYLLLFQLLICFKIRYPSFVCLFCIVLWFFFSFNFVFVWHGVLYSPCWPWTPYMAENDLESWILLLPSPKCWDYGLEPTHQSAVLFCVTGKSEMKCSKIIRGSSSAKSAEKIAWVLGGWCCDSPITVCAYGTQLLPYKRRAQPAPKTPQDKGSWGIPTGRLTLVVLCHRSS